MRDYLASVQSCLTLNCPSHSHSPMGQSSSVPVQAHSGTIILVGTLKKWFWFLTCVKSARTEGAYSRILFDALPGSSITRIRQDDFVLGALQKTTIIITLIREVVTVESLIRVLSAVLFFTLIYVLYLTCVQFSFIQSCSSPQHSPRGFFALMHSGGLVWPQDEFMISKMQNKIDLCAITIILTCWMLNVLKN